MNRKTALSLIGLGIAFFMMFALAANDPIKGASVTGSPRKTLMAGTTQTYVYSGSLAACPYLIGHTESESDDYWAVINIPQLDLAKMVTLEVYASPGPDYYSQFPDALPSGTKFIPVDTSDIAIDNGKVFIKYKNICVEDVHIYIDVDYTNFRIALMTSDSIIIIPISANGVDPTVSNLYR